MRSSLRRARGYVLVLVLTVLLVLSVVVASLFTVSGEYQAAAQVMVSQKVAAARADEAAQRGIAWVKNGGVALSALTPCDGPTTVLQTGGCTTSGLLTSYLQEGTDGGDYVNGNGWRYQWWAYRPGPLHADGTIVGPNDTMMRVYAEGYCGKGDGGTANFSVAAVEAEVLIPIPPSGGVSFEDDYGVLK